MAMCEKCQKSGFDPKGMFIEADQFVGPCCATQGAKKVFAQPPKFEVLPFERQSSEGLEYGVEISNKVGVHAYVNYQGLQVSFERSPKELRAWAERQGLMEKTGT